MEVTTRPLLRDGDDGASIISRPILFRVLTSSALQIAPSRHALDRCERVEIGRGADTGWERDGTTLRLAVADGSMSSRQARLTRGPGGWELEDLESTNGSRRNGEAVGSAILADGDRLELGATTFILRASMADLVTSAADLGGASLAPEPGLRTLLPSLQLAFAELRTLAPSRLSLAISGPTGAGKELIAAAVHRLSGRAGRLVAVNCAALPPTLAESELFGHRRGAFSGAERDKEGLIEASSGGTLFLDEVGDLSANLQALLLRALQERAVRRIGETEPRPVDLRVVSATHRDLGQMVERGEFRDDLRSRLVGSTLALPPLAERREDLGLLIASIATDLGRPDAALTQEAAQTLINHDWPRNVRELRQVLERALALSRDGVISRRELPAELARPPGDADAARRAELIALLAEHGGNISAVARAMGKARQQIHRWLDRYKINASDYR